ncbi:RNA methyltransferase [Desertihabitans brevis]|uniref:RNA methyltransferase n=1 Tax=Desertihabitans brevis TaxID=2268447 RepID=A0A367YUD4_9ACTN|nr:TfoX/Sxy family protein [Desertihabitans brevis]RCK69428.1 RNA methyltransferase [Desertihabitans brevis]
MEELEDRVRATLAGHEDVREVRMFGYRCFMVGEKLRVGVGGAGGLLVRTGPERYQEALGWPGARPALMKDRPMPGWVDVDAATLGTVEALRRWVGLSLEQ